MWLILRFANFMAQLLIYNFLFMKTSSIIVNETGKNVQAQQNMKLNNNFNESLWELVIVRPR